MREVIKIAFRRENIDVVAYADAASALTNIEQSKPDVIITDVIMPDKDGYEVCQHIKQHPRLNTTPVILMSGVVNRAVAEKAFSVKADELIRKPFQPQDLITRVRHLLKPNAGQAATPAESVASAVSAASALSSIFQAPAPAPAAMPRAAAPAPRPVAPPAFTQPPLAYQPPAPVAVPAAASVPRAIPPMPTRASVGVGAAPATSPDVAKLRLELLRLE